jgi:hypothetical protein
MGNAKYGFIAILLFIAELTAPAQTSIRDNTRAEHLEDVIETLSLTDGAEAIGGASIEDAVNVLRDNLAFPVALEMIEFERPRDFVTLDEALIKLRSMQAVRPLATRDKARLDSYEKLAKTHPGSEVLLPRQKSFTLVRDRITVRDLLDQITILDDEYQWRNYGTESTPVVVIQPRSESVLNWRVSSICKPRPVAIDQILAGCNSQECGAFTKVLAERNMSIMYVSIGPVQKADPQPHGFIDLCDEMLTARDVLNRVAQSAHTSWTLSGIKGLRVISFNNSLRWQERAIPNLLNVSPRSKRALNGWR